MIYNNLHAFLAAAFVAVLAAYLLVGVLFAIPFVIFGVGKIDSHAAHAGWGFRALIFPGAMFLWPVLLRRWILTAPPPTEKTAHRL